MTNAGFEPVPSQHTAPGVLCTMLSQAVSSCSFHDLTDPQIVDALVPKVSVSRQGCEGGGC